MSYSNKTKETALLAKKEDINNYFRYLGKELPNTLITMHKHEMTDSIYIDALATIGGKKFAFRFTSTKYDVELNNNKNWKILKSKSSRMNDKPQKNPMKWFPGVIDADYYIYPVRKPSNNITYRRSVECVGNYAHTLEYIIKKINKGI